MPCESWGGRQEVGMWAHCVRHGSYGSVGQGFRSHGRGAVRGYGAKSFQSSQNALKWFGSSETGLFRMGVIPTLAWFIMP